MYMLRDRYRKRLPQNRVEKASFEIRVWRNFSTT